MRTILILLALAAPLTAATASAFGTDTLGISPGHGLRFQSGVLPAASAAGNELTAWLGGGYDFNRRLSLDILFHTGHLHIAPAAHRPVTGTFLLGGASLELRARLLKAGPAGLIVGAGGGLFTALKKTGPGYNGSGAYLLGGLTLQIFRDLEAAPVVRCGWWSWRNGVGGGVEPFDPFTQFWYGAGLTLTFRPRFP